MNQQTRDRALRALAAGLLNSGLTSREIREVARSLVSDPSLIEDMARLVSVLVKNLSPHPEPKQVQLRFAESEAISAEDFIREAEAVALSKSDFLNRLKSYARTDWSPSIKWPRKRILKSFLEAAPASSWRAALAVLKAGPVEPDPYVELILNHDKARHG